MGKADDILAERQERKLRPLVALHVARREALYARCVNAADYRSALAVLQDLAKLQGLYPEPKSRRLLREMMGKLDAIERQLPAPDGPAPDGRAAIPTAADA